MVDRRPIHLGHVLPNFLAHQCQHVRLSAIFTGPFVTRLVQGMGLLEYLEGLLTVSTLAPLGNEAEAQAQLETDLDRALDHLSRLVPP